MPATSDLLNRPCVSEDMAKLAHHRYVQSEHRAVFLDGVRAEMARHQWQPIETAPQDGRWILAYWPECYSPAESICPTRWDDETVDGPRFVDIADHRMDQPTHWMPMPNPPSAEANHAR